MKTVILKISCRITEPATIFRKEDFQLMAGQIFHALWNPSFQFLILNLDFHALRTAVVAEVSTIILIYFAKM